MKFKIGEDEYIVGWKHVDFKNPRTFIETHPPGEYGLELNAFSYRGETVCHVKKNGQSYALATAHCSSKEPQFIKEKGRKISLTRVLETFPREIRERFWMEYFNRGVTNV